MEPQDLLPRIGIYDEFAIEWGYRCLQETNNLVENNLKLRAWVDEKRKDPKMFYIVETDYSVPGYNLKIVEMTSSRRIAWE